jgi:hypothetical protein
MMPTLSASAHVRDVAVDDVVVANVRGEPAVQPVYLNWACVPDQRPATYPKLAQ